MHRMRLWALVRRKGRPLFAASVVLLVLTNISGVLIHPFEMDFGDNFSYPLDLANLREIIEKHKDGSFPATSPQTINEYSYRLMIKNADKCQMPLMPIENGARSVSQPLRLVVMVKSAIAHRRRRDAIRKTWGAEDRFSDVSIRRLFVVGSCRGVPAADVQAMVPSPVPGEYDFRSCQELLDEEAAANGDVVQADFADTYYNNTIKTMVGMKWVVNYCHNAQYAFFVDDDYYVSMKNLLRFIRSPFSPSAADSSPSNSLQASALAQPRPSSAPKNFDGRLYAGFVFANSSPMRHKTSKWYVPLDEYRYSRFPPYVTAGAFVLSRDAYTDMYYASLYTQHFRFDDIYVGILAKKVSIAPVHSDHFYYWRKPYDLAEYRDVIATHGFDDPKELIRVWLEQKAANAA